MHFASKKRALVFSLFASGPMDFFFFFLRISLLRTLVSNTTSNLVTNEKEKRREKD